MKFTFKNIFAVFITASQLAGSPISSLMMLLSSIRGQGFRATLTSVSEFAVRVDAERDCNGNMQYLDYKKSIADEWKVQSEYSKQLRKSAPIRRKGQLIHAPSESNLGKWLALNLRPIISFDPHLIVLAEGPTLGGNERFLQAFVETSLAQRPSNRILTVRTKGRAIVNSSKERQMEVDFESQSLNLSENQKRLLLEILIASIPSKIVIISNSRLGWDYLSSERPPLRQSKNFFATLYCPDYDNFGREIGFSETHFPDAVANLKGVISDNYEYPQAIISKNSDRVEVRPKVYRFSPPTRFRNTNLKPQSDNSGVLWIGRLVRQKGFSTIPKIAKQNPQIHFDIFGSGSPSVQRKFSKKIPKNAIFWGQLGDLGQLQELKSRIFLNTSIWDGMPNVIIEMLSLGMPVVTTKLPGIVEFSADHPGLPVFFFDPSNSRQLKQRLEEASQWLKIHGENMSTALLEFRNVHRIAFEAEIAAFLEENLD